MAALALLDSPALGRFTNTPRPPVMSPSQMNASQVVATVIASVSIGGSLLIVLVYILSRITRPSLTDRTTIRLLVIKSSANIIIGCMVIVNDYVYTKAGCSIIFSFFLWMILFSLFLQALMGLNVLVVFVLRRTFQPRTGTYVVLGCLLLSLICTVIPLAAGRFDYSYYYDACFIVPVSAPDAYPWVWGSLLWPSLLACVILIGCQVAVIIALLRSRIYIRSLIANETSSARSPIYQELVGQQLATLRMIRRSVIRILFYILVPLATTLCPFWHYLVVYYTHTRSFVFILFYFILVPSQGILDALIFITEPAFSGVFRSWRHSLIKHARADVHDTRPPLYVVQGTHRLRLGRPDGQAADAEQYLRPKGPGRRLRDRFALRVLCSNCHEAAETEESTCGTPEAVSLRHHEIQPTLPKRPESVFNPYRDREQSDWSGQTIRIHRSNSAPTTAHTEPPSQYTSSAPSVVEDTHPNSHIHPPWTNYIHELKRM
ncbi:hypothetical protein IWQ60_000465 [Tieghemiomyces parasiticus]|uniref:G-protein coupled receptors family 1 profile domain-containing protein n=1 Tax=Tieghemiomyces parasiticus TaxID=78921 RepID=A0A9W8AM57_9FUNG|nr:hypothetical protein IWQ60_000465 [Tieghemiomyces parasiticus]